MWIVWHWNPNHSYLATVWPVLYLTQPVLLYHSHTIVSLHCATFFATLVALHFTPVSESVSGWVGRVSDKRSLELLFCKQTSKSTHCSYQAPVWAVRHSPYVHWEVGCDRSESLWKDQNSGEENRKMETAGGPFKHTQVWCSVDCQTPAQTVHLPIGCDG